VANRHYAKIGDVWKHLALAQLLQTQAPAAYWESHAGAADYALTHSLARDYGAYYFFDNAQRSEGLLRTPYYEILRSLASGAGELRTYPGSPLIAMKVLKDAATRFLFCDIDRDSLSTTQRRTGETRCTLNRARHERRDQPLAPPWCGFGLHHRGRRPTGPARPARRSQSGND